MEVTTSASVVPTATTASKVLYNSSQPYETSHYDPYYSLYEDDVELYRDAGKSVPKGAKSVESFINFAHPEYNQNYNNHNNYQTPQQTYRSSSTQAYQSTPSQETKRGNSVYIQNSYAQEDYRHPSLQDYADNNSYNVKVLNAHVSYFHVLFTSCLFPM